MDVDHKQNKNVIFADLGLVFASILWGAGYGAIELGLKHITPMYLNAFRFGFAAIILAIVFYKKTIKINKDDIIAGLVIGFFMFGGFAFSTMGQKTVSVGVTGFLTCTFTVFVPIFVLIIYKQKPTKYIVAGCTLCMIGIALLSLHENLTLGFGEMLLLFGAVSFSFDIISTEYFAKRRDPITITITQTAVSAILYIICAALFEPVPELAEVKKAIMPVSYLVICSTFIANSIVNVSLKYTSSTHEAIINSSEAVFASIFGMILFNEIMTGRMVIGCILILLSIIIIETKLEFLKCFKNRILGENIHEV